MIDRTPPTSEARDQNRRTRFEATLHRGERQGELKTLPGLDLDRLPSPNGEVRILITIDEAARLVELGFEVHLLKAHPIRPLDGSLVADDKAVRERFEERVKGVERQGGD